MKRSKGAFSLDFVTFNDLTSALEMIFSPSAASMILFTAAVKCGTQSFVRMKKGFGTREEALQILSKKKKEENWGELSFRDVDFVNGLGKIVVDDSFETVALKSRKGQPCCNFLRGFLSGFLSELFDKSVTVEEKRCVGQGDEKCEFAFG